METMEIAMKQESVRGRPPCSIKEEEEVMRKQRDFNPVIEEQDLLLRTSTIRNPWA